MNIQKVFNFLNDKYPINTQEEFDQCGLFFNHDNKVDKALVCLDINLNIVNFSINNNVNLIIAHHPIFLENEKYPLNEYNQKIIMLLKKNSIAILFLHTCFDKSDEGMNYVLSKKLGLKNIEKLDNSEYIFKGELKIPVSLDIFLISLPELLNVNHANYHKNFEKKMIKTVAICGGSGSSFMFETKNKVDLYITCDMKYHNWLDSLNNDICILDLNHNIENVFINKIKDDLKNFNDVKVLTFTSEIDIVRKNL